MTVSRGSLPVIFLIALILGVGCTRQTAPSRPHIVLISIDTLSSLHMEVYGYPRPTTPFLSKLAREAVVFENTRAQSTHTTASHYSLFTGRFPQGHKVIAEYDHDGMKPNLPALDKSIPTLTGYLKNAGYATHMAGTVYDPELAMKRGLDRGFDRLENLLLQWHRTAAAAETLLQKLGAAASVGRPFFFFIHTYMVHAPYCAGSPHARAYNPDFTRELEIDCASLVATALKKPAPYGIPDPREMSALFDRQFDTAKPGDVNQLVALYDGGVLEADKLIEAVAARLKSAGVFEDTVFIVTSDHGEAFGEHGQFKHISAYREVLNIPLIVKIPKVKGTRVKEEALSVDVVPTVLEILNIKPTAPLDGVSLMPAIKGRALKRDGPAFALSIDEGAIWEKGWKLVVPNQGPNRLFEIVADPLEKNDLAPAKPEVASQLALKLNAARLESRAR